MRLPFDECVDVGLAVPLRAAGHDVAFVQDIEPRAKRGETGDGMAGADPF